MKIIEQPHKTGNSGAGIVKYETWFDFDYTKKVSTSITPQNIFQLNSVIPANNLRLPVIPQILGNDPQLFIDLAFGMSFFKEIAVILNSGKHIYRI